MSLKEKTDAFIEAHRGQMLEDLKTLVRINSQRGEASPGRPYGEGPAKALEEAARMMSEYGLNVKDYDHCVVTGTFGDQEKGLDILAHLDVVPVTDAWTVTKPFEPKIVDGRIYGRGTADDKGPAIAALYAIRAVKEAGVPLKKSVSLILGSDEECGSSDLPHYYSKEEEAPCTFSPDADYPVINLEKARLASHFEAAFDPDKNEKALVSLHAGDKVNVVPANAAAVLRGIRKNEIEQQAAGIQEKTGTTVLVTDTEDGCRIQVTGAAAHGSMPECGNNALTALLGLLDAILPDSQTASLVRSMAKLFPHGDTKGTALGIAMGDEQSGDLSMNLGILHIENGVLSGQFDVRAPLCANNENVTARIAGKLKEAGITMEEDQLTPVHYVPADTPFVQTLLQTYEEYFGKPGKPIYTGGGTYVHELKRGVAFGCMVPETDNHMHGDDEFMEIDMLVRSAKIFASVIRKICCE